VRPPEEIGYVGFNNERVVVLCDLNDKSLDKLIALENFIFRYKEDMFRIPEEEDRPQVSVVFTEIPYIYSDGVFVPKNNKLAMILKWRDVIKNDVQVIFTAIGDYSAPISLMEYNKKKVYVNIYGEFSSSKINSEIIPIHVINPISDILFGMKFHDLLKDFNAIWFSPSICSMHSKAYLEDTFIEKEVVVGYDHFKYLVNDDRNIACVATSISDFMSFCQEVIAYANSASSVVNKPIEGNGPIKLGLFIGFTPERAEKQKFYWTFNNFMNFIENRAQIVDVTFYVSDIESAEFSDIDKSLLKYVPSNVELYHTKILESIC